MSHTSVLLSFINAWWLVFIHANSYASFERGGEKSQNMHDCIETFSQLVHIHLVSSLIIPWCNETRGCQCDAAHPELCPSRGEALNEKVTSHPPVKEQMPHQSISWQEEQVSLLGTRDALGVAAGMAIQLTHMNSQAHKSRTTHTQTHKMPDPSPWEWKTRAENRSRTFSSNDHTGYTKALTVDDVWRSEPLSWDSYTILSLQSKQEIFVNQAAHAVTLQ